MQISRLTVGFNGSGSVCVRGKRMMLQMLEWRMKSMKNKHVFVCQRTDENDGAA